MSTITCSQGHPNPEGANFCIVCGESLSGEGARVNTPATLPPGERLRDRYVVREQLGEGGFGRTYLVEDTGRFDERFVLKEFLPAHHGTYALKKAVELFRREAVMLYQLKHDQIPKFWEIFQDNSRLFLVEDFIEGHTYESLLNERIRNRETFSEAEVTQLLKNLLPVLIYLHGEGVIHRDISPDNIILSTKTNLPVLIDLGAAKQTVLNITSIRSTSAPQATMIGKVGYSPDEQVRLGIVAPNSDLYALAVTSIVLLTGKQPTQLLDQRTLTWNWETQTTVDPAFANIINRMLASQPGQRFQTAEEALQAFESTQPTAQTQAPSPQNIGSEPTVISTGGIPPSPTPSPAPSTGPSTGGLPPFRAPQSGPPSNPTVPTPPPAGPSGDRYDYLNTPPSINPIGGFASPADNSNNSGSGKLFDSTIPVPGDIKKMNWGAFWLGPIWCIGSKVWLGVAFPALFVLMLLFSSSDAMVGLLFLIMVIVLPIVFGFKGSEWAWKSRRWASVEQFKTYQGTWSISGWICGAIVILLILIGLSAP